MDRRPIVIRMILLEIGLLVAIAAFFVAIDAYVRGCEHL
jgi:hypothetical protein